MLNKYTIIQTDPAKYTQKWVIVAYDLENAWQHAQMDGNYEMGVMSTITKMKTKIKQSAKVGIRTFYLKYL